MDKQCLCLETVSCCGDIVHFEYNLIESKHLALHHGKTKFFVDDEDEDVFSTRENIPLYDLHYDMIVHFGINNWYFPFLNVHNNFCL